MAIIVPENYHAKQALENARVHCISSFNAQKQDFRPLRIAILNIMPEANTYEYNILFPIGRAIIQIEPVWIRLKTHAYKSTSKEHLDELYISFEEAIKYKGLDGLIITGAPVEEKSFKDVWFWDELSGILDYAKDNIASTLGICWGGLALANYIGIDKMLFDKKLFGVYPLDNIDRNNRITGDLDDVFMSPQSRHAGISDKVLEAERDKGNISLLAHSDEAGYVIFETTDKSFIMHLGHPEYETDRLVNEYKRDLAKGRPDVPMPLNLNINDPKNNWRGHSLEFFQQWVKDVYIRTPYEI
ncbi:MAG: homoserine O-succinyltransferase [Spirochaetia bacterium]|jgi:homoserine O-succinyltransferase|nr:homoserine O-succinyltransferase [Spirochaetia bacterium]